MILRPSISLFALIASAGFASAQVVVPVVSATSHDNRENFGGNVQDVLNGSGMNGVVFPDDQTSWPPTALPSTWTAGGNSYRDDWQGLSQLAEATNDKIGWITLDLGAVVTTLDEMYLWNVRERTDRGTNTFNIYYSTAPDVAPPTDTTGVDYDFSSGGWTLANTSGVETLGARVQGDAVSAEGIFKLGGISARYIGIEILTAHGATDRVGLAEIGITSSNGSVAPSTLEVTEVQYDPASDSVTLTWRANSTSSYRVIASTDLIDFTSEIASGLDSGDDEEPSDEGLFTATIELGATEFAASSKLFFRLEEE